MYVYFVIHNKNNMKKILFASVVALILLACKKDKVDEETVFTPSSFVFQDTLVNPEIEYYTGDSCVVELDSAISLLFSSFSIAELTDAVFQSITFYEKNKAYLMINDNGATTVYDAYVHAINGTVVFTFDFEPGYTAQFTAYGNLDSFYFLTGVSAVFNFENGTSHTIQSSGAMQGKDFNRETLTPHGFQLNMYYRAAFVKE